MHVNKQKIFQLHPTEPGKMQVTVFREMTPCSLVKIHLCFGRTCCYSFRVH